MTTNTQPTIDIEEQRRWLIDQNKTAGVSWSDLGKRIGRPSGTLSQFGSEKGYNGDEQKVAEEIARYRHTVASRASIAIRAPQEPGYFETETSSELTTMLRLAQVGDIVVAALGPGLGKTQTAKQFKASYSNVIMATMAPSSAGVNNAQVAILRAFGEREVKGTPQALSWRIIERFEQMQNPLLILDEAQHLSEKSLEEIRSWADACGVGIALFGNTGVIQRLEGGGRKETFAQLFSRLGMRMVRALPLEGDIVAQAHAWGIRQGELIAQLRKIAMRPGGLRNSTKALKLGHMLAAADNSTLTGVHLQNAWAQLSGQLIAG